MGTTVGCGNPSTILSMLVGMVVFFAVVLLAFFFSL
jgi:hypothetical protein